ncbi:uncharacterized protein LOC126824047 isoform X2 [Patella vulgata]|uniref:uncharacterized protein LOC126824047 isoform X2 n=1 Tax=Patella vulgata TaxID=6465 RepID=UPI0021803B04|nr:uncharacterized protein LOC126824047 isoform X2 [Patella vulgata]
MLNVDSCFLITAAQFQALSRNGDEVFDSCTSFTRTSSSSSSDSVFINPSPRPSSSSSGTDIVITHQNASDCVSVNKNPGWAQQIEIPFGKLPSDILVPLNANKPLSAEKKRKMVRILVDEFRKTSRHITCSQFRTLAHRITSRYSILQDKIDNQIVGLGFESFSSKLIIRNDNLNRGSSPFAKQKRKTDTGTNSDTTTEKDTEVSSTLKKKDSYGCISWSPVIENIDALEQCRNEMVDIFREHHDVVNWNDVEPKLSFTFALQRKEINESAPISDLLERWPFLFQLQGIINHFRHLTDIDLLNTMTNKVNGRASRILSFFKESKTDYLDDIPATLRQLTILLLKYFKEKEEDLFVYFDETRTKQEVQNKVKDMHEPKIAVLGTTIADSDIFYLVVDGIIILKTSSFLSAFSSYFASFYIINIEYPESLSGLLEFFQRCIFGINPDNGQKSKKRRKTQVCQKVLKLINELSNFEWME